MDNNTQQIIHYIKTHLPLFQYRDVLIELFALVDRAIASPLSPDLMTRYSDRTHIITAGHIYIGKLVVTDTDPTNFYEISTLTTISSTSAAVTLVTTGITVPTDAPLVNCQTPVILSAGDIANYPKGPDINTNVGRLILNYLLFAEPFGSAIPYHNAVFTPSFLSTTVSKSILESKEFNAELYRHYTRNLLFIGQVPEFSVPVYSRKSLTTDPRIKDEKKKLIAQYQDRLDAGDAVAMAEIEAKLIAMDKEYLKGDKSMGFLISDKSFNVHRKKMYLTAGMTKVFGQKGEFKFVDHSLAEGWDPKDFVTIVNESREGSFGRAIETAVGGEISKFLMRVFQTARVTEQDCQTKHTLPTLVTPTLFPLLLYRNYVDDDGEIRTITNAMKDELVGKTINLRSPMTCATQHGYCFVCMGEMISKLDQKALTLSVVYSGSEFVLNSLKGFHGQKTTVTEITALDSYTF